MGPLLSLIQIILGPSSYNLFLMLQVLIQHLMDIQHLGLIVDQGQHDHTKGILKLGVF